VFQVENGVNADINSGSTVFLQFTTFLNELNVRISSNVNIKLKVRVDHKEKLRKN